MEYYNLVLDQQVGQRYKEALEKAIEIAVDSNLEEIKGCTAIFVDVSGSMDN